MNGSGLPASPYEDPDSYVHSRALAKKLRDVGSRGIAFDSVRRASADDIAVFRLSIPAAAPGKLHVTQGSHVGVEWDGSRMSRYIVMGDTNWTMI